MRSHKSEAIGFLARAEKFTPRPFRLAHGRTQKQRLVAVFAVHFLLRRLQLGDERGIGLRAGPVEGEEKGGGQKGFQHDHDGFLAVVICPQCTHNSAPAQVGRVNDL